MKVGALIPCRTGSKGIPNKNFKDFNGKPLTQWSYDAAIQSGLFSKIIISSDGGAGSLVLRETEPAILDNERPGEFATDDADLDSLLWYYAGKHPDIELWCLLQPTSPLRTADDIKKSYKLIKPERYDSLVSVMNHPCFCWIKDAAGLKGKSINISTYHYHKRPNRQQRKDWFLENGAIYWTKRYVLETTKCRLGGYVGLYPMPPERSIEIDEPLDWFVASKIGEQWVG